jgi:hypothetical protein
MSALPLYEELSSDTTIDNTTTTNTIDNTTTTNTIDNTTTTNTIDNTTTTNTIDNTTNTIDNTTNWSLISNIVSQLPPEHGEILYALILHHYYTYDNGKDTKRKPYGIKNIGEKGIIVPVDRLPQKLKCVILRYLKWIEALPNTT